MSAQFLSIHDDSHARHFRVAERRKLEYRLTDDSNVIEVSSFSRRGLWHRVELVGEEARCFCESATSCSHLALALSHWFLVTCWLKWFTDECDAEIMFRYRIVSGAPLSPFEQRKLRRAMKLVQSTAQKPLESAGTPF